MNIHSTTPHIQSFHQTSHQIIETVPDLVQVQKIAVQAEIVKMCTGLYWMTHHLVPVEGVGKGGGRGEQLVGVFDVDPICEDQDHLIQIFSYDFLPNWERHC